MAAGEGFEPSQTESEPEIYHAKPVVYQSLQATLLFSLPQYLPFSQIGMRLSLPLQTKQRKELNILDYTNYVGFIDFAENKMAKELLRFSDACLSQYEAEELAKEIVSKKEKRILLGSWITPSEPSA